MTRRMKRPPGRGEVVGAGGWGVAGGGVDPGHQPKAGLSPLPIFQEEGKIPILMWKFPIIRLFIFLKHLMTHISNL